MRQVECKRRYGCSRIRSDPFQLQDILISIREYALLLLLMEHSGQVLSRDQILREVWHDQQSAASNVIEVYVRYLRQKLEEVGERRLIHTIRGQGYCLSERLPQLEGRS